MGQQKASDALPPGEEPWLTISGGWVGPRTRLDFLKGTTLPLPGLELRTVQPAA